MFRHVYYLGKHLFIYLFVCAWVCFDFIWFIWPVRDTAERTAPSSKWKHKKGIILISSVVLEHMCTYVCVHLCVFIWASVCACVQGGCLLVYTGHSCKLGWWAHEAKGQQKASQPASLCFRFSPPIPSHNCHSLAWLTPLVARADSSFCRPNRHCYKSHILCEKLPPPQQKLLINMWHLNDIRTWQKQQNLTKAAELQHCLQ